MRFNAQLHTLAVVAFAHFLRSAAIDIQNERDSAAAAGESRAALQEFQVNAQGSVVRRHRPEEYGQTLSDKMWAHIRNGEQEGSVLETQQDEIVVTTAAPVAAAAAAAGATTAAAAAAAAAATTTAAAGATTAAAGATTAAVGATTPAAAAAAAGATTPAAVAAAVPGVAGAVTTTEAVNATNATGGLSAEEKSSLVRDILILAIVLAGFACMWQFFKLLAGAFGGKSDDGSRGRGPEGEASTEASGAEAAAGRRSYRERRGMSKSEPRPAPVADGGGEASDVPSAAGGGRKSYGSRRQNKAEEASF